MPIEIKSLPKIKSLKRRLLLYEAVQDEIRSYIIQHSLKTGDPLPPETELARQLHVSRNSVREAVKSLAALGILQARPGAGLFVREFSFDPLLKNLAYGLMVDLQHLIEMLEIRFHTDLGMAERLVQKATPEQVKKLYSVVGRMEKAVQDEGYLPDEDRTFHKILYENLQNATLSRVMDIFWLVCHQARKQSPVPKKIDPRKVYEQHHGIVMALEAADVEKLREAIAGHYSVIGLRLEQLREGAQSKKASA